MSEEQNTGINIIDLQNVVKIIDAAAERGAFKGNELTSVGVVRDRIASFVVANMPKEEVTPEAETPVQEEEKPKAKKALRKTTRK